jgi:hypothetical protein
LGLRNGSDITIMSWGVGVVIVESLGCDGRSLIVSTLVLVGIVRWSGSIVLGGSDGGGGPEGE